MKKTITCVLIFLWGTALAQDAKEQSNQLDKNAFVPSGTTTASNNVTSAKLFTTSDGTAAAVNLGLSLNDNFSGNISVSGPLSKKGNAKPIDFQGLAFDGQATIGLQYKRWSSSPDAAEIQNALKGTGFESFTDIKDPKVKSRVLRSLNLGTPWFIGITGTLNRQSFEYATDETLTTIEEDDKYSFSTSFYSGLYVGRKINTLLRFAFVYEKSYDENEKNDYYIPFNGGPTLIRKEITIGQPPKVKEAVFKLDLVTRPGLRWGLNPSVTYRQSSSDVVIEMPIYFIPEQKEGRILDLNGGIILNYIPTANSFAAGIFIGTNLNDILPISK
jgi:hypothetical protein